MYFASHKSRKSHEGCIAEGSQLSWWMRTSQSYSASASGELVRQPGEHLFGLCRCGGSLRVVVACRT